MTNFNNLPLAEKIKNAVMGDVVVTDSVAQPERRQRNPRKG